MGRDFLYIFFCFNYKSPVVSQTEEGITLPWTITFMRFYICLYFYSFLLFSFSFPKLLKVHFKQEWILLVISSKGNEIECWRNKTPFCYRFLGVLAYIDKIDDTISLPIKFQRRNNNRFLFCIYQTYIYIHISCICVWYDAIFIDSFNFHFYPFFLITFKSIPLSK